MEADPSESCQLLINFNYVSYVSHIRNLFVSLLCRSLVFVRGDNASFGVPSHTISAGRPNEVGRKPFHQFTRYAAAATVLAYLLWICPG